MEPGEVLGPGGKALTIVDLSDVYMEIFLPAEQAAAIKVGRGSANHPRLPPERLRPRFGQLRVA